MIQYSRMMLFVVPCLFLSLFLSGCTANLQSKTIVIPDSEANAGQDAAVNEDFQINKIYKLTEDESAFGRIWGWIDQDQVLGTIWRPDRDQDIERIDYKNNAHAKLTTWSGEEEVGGISPDGQYLVSFERKSGIEQIKRLQLTSRQETILGETAAGQVRSSPLTWSNNSRYLAYIQGKRNQPAGATLVVYDMNGPSTKTYTLPSGKAVSVQVSNDGLSALLVMVSENQSTLLYGTLDGTAFTSQFEHSFSRGGSADFMNDDQILFIGQNGALLGYDRRNATTTVMLEQTGTFRLSRDRKYVAYTKGRENIYAAKLQGNNVMNEKVIYQGIVPSQMDWSPDGKKILINGWKPFEARPQPPVSAPAAQLETSPFIIELKSS